MTYPPSHERFAPRPLRKTTVTRHNTHQRLNLNQPRNMRSQNLKRLLFPNLCHLRRQHRPHTLGL